MGVILSLDQISFSYRRGSKVKNIFSGFSLSVEKGEKLIVKGKSGSGKSTLLRLMAWLEDPDEGRLFLDQKPYDSYEPTRLRRRVSMVQQTPVMLDGSTRYNMTLGCEAKLCDDDLLGWMDKLGLEAELLDRSARSLSVGQQQRVAAIRTLLVKPDVLLLDEPTSGLDEESAKMFVSAMERLIAESGLTVVWVTHDATVLKDAEARTLTIGGAAG